MNSVSTRDVSQARPILPAVPTKRSRAAATPLHRARPPGELVDRKAVHEQVVRQDSLRKHARADEPAKPSSF